MPAVSIIVPAYNAEKYLPRCLDSILNQTLEDIEVLCVNDGSSDSTLDIMRKYEHADERIVIIDKANAGYGAGVNDGLHAATGEYVGIVESDDEICPNAYETYYKAATENGGLDIVKSDFSRFWDEASGRRLERVRLSPQPIYYNRVFDPSSDADALRTYCLNQPGIYRKALIDEHNIKLNESPGASFQDNGLLFQLFVSANSCMFLNESLYLLRRDNENSSTKSKEKVFAICDEYDFICETLRTNPKVSHEALEVCAVRRLHNCHFTMGRVASDLRYDFALRCHEDFLRLEEAGELNKERFTRFEWLQIQQILASPMFWFQTMERQRDLNATRSNLQKLKKQRGSKTARPIVAAARKVKSVLRHGKDFPQVLQTGVGVHVSPTGQPAEPNNFHGAFVAWKDVPSDIPMALSGWFARKANMSLDLHSPQSLWEKFQWLKIYGVTPQKTMLSDRCATREFVEKRLGAAHLVPVLGEWESFEAIDFEALPDAFVVKLAHFPRYACSAIEGAHLDWEKCKKRVDNLMRKNFAFESGYDLRFLNVPPKVVVEKNLDPKGVGLGEYRVNCAMGAPFSVSYSDASGRNGARVCNIYDLNWNLQPVVLSGRPGNKSPVPKPEQLADMLDMAAALAEGLEYASVKFYVVDGQIYFGKISLSPMSGLIEFRPADYAWRCGELISLPTERDLSVLEEIERIRA